MSDNQEKSLPQIAYEAYAKTRGRGGDQNDGPAWEAVVDVVVKTFLDRSIRQMEDLSKVQGHKIDPWFK